jgi:hypothetical protein
MLRSLKFKNVSLEIKSLFILVLNRYPDLVHIVVILNWLCINISSFDLVKHDDFF